MTIRLLSAARSSRGSYSLTRENSVEVEPLVCPCEELVPSSAWACVVLVLHADSVHVAHISTAMATPIALVRFMIGIGYGTGRKLG